MPESVERAIRYRDTLFDLADQHDRVSLRELAWRVDTEYVQTGIGLTPETEHSILREASECLR